MSDWFSPLGDGHAHDTISLKRTAYYLVMQLVAQRGIPYEGGVGGPSSSPDIPIDLGELARHLQINFFRAEVSSALLALAIHIRVILDRLRGEKKPAALPVCGKLSEAGGDPLPLKFRDAANKIIHADRVEFVWRRGFDDAEISGLALIFVGRSEPGVVYRAPEVRLVGMKGKSDWIATVDLVLFVRTIFLVLDHWQAKLADEELQKQRFLDEALSAREAGREPSQ